MFMSTSVMHSFLKILSINGFAKAIFGFYCLYLIFAQAKSQGVGGQLHFQYFGCFKGNGISEIIDTPPQNTVTIDSCIELCYNKTVQRKTFAGLSNGNTCVCSDHFGRQVSDNECKVKCTGSGNQYCGGISSVSAPIYSVYSVCQVGYFGSECNLSCHCKDQYPCGRESGVCSNGCEEHWDGRSCNISKVNIKEEYIGCYRDNQTAAMDRKNPGKENGGNYEGVNSIDFCIGICSSFNFTYAGMQYRYDCNCGERYSRYGSVDEGDCNFKCPANSNQKCGGNWVNSVYYACPTGFYGLNCIHRCSCANGRCSNSGCLKGGCKPGWTGATCNVRDCEANNGDCGPNRQCTKINLGFETLNECRCKTGYLKLGTECVKIYDHYIGCYKGNLSPISLTVQHANDQLTIEICIIWCHQLNKTYAMLKAGNTCMCGYNLSELVIQSDDKCDLPCLGNRQQNCGWKNNMDSGYVVYSVTDGTSCSSDNGCGRDESCKEISLDFNKIKRCRCKEGFEQQKPLDSCTDVDECFDFPRICPTAFNCTNTIGSFRCSYCSDGLVAENGTCVVGNPTHNESQHGVIPIIAGIFSFVLLLVLIIVIAFFVLKKRKRGRKEENKSESQSKADRYVSVAKNSNHEKTAGIDLLSDSALYTNRDQITSKIKVKEFSNNLKHKKSIPGTIEREFKSVPFQDETKSCLVGKKMPKCNRFKNILPYDYNRVILSKDKHQSANDYINASFITSYNENEKLIATQGPKAETIKDFWRMIYENDAKGIVMIANVIENGKKKCECYWPESEKSLEIEDLTITLKLTELWPNYIIRHLQLSKNGKTMDLKQYHFTLWPDHGVPSDIKGFLDFRGRVRQSLPLNKYTVVHCSAGVGRTGTFIAINYLLEQAEVEGFVDVLACLRYLRDQRPQMVQTLEQYEFIYTALAIEFKVGQTVIFAEQFDAMYQKLTIKDKETGKTPLEVQFEVLEEQTQHQNCGNAYAVVPKSGNISDPLKTDIVFVQSWKRSNAYIVSDYPMEESRNYFWTICSDYDCKILIYIDNGQQSDYFFPTQQGPMSVGNWRVLSSSVSKETYGSCYNVTLSHISESEYTNTVISASKELKVLHVNPFGNSTSSLQYEILHCLHSAIKTFVSVDEAGTAPVVIVNGTKCTLGGLFVAAFNAFDMLTERKEVDVFQIVYDIKKSRPQLIESLAAYKELHSIINHRISFTSGSSVYGNM